MSIQIVQAKPSDYNSLNKYVNKLSKEDTYIYLSGENISLEDDKLLLKNIDEKDIPKIYFAKNNDTVIGMAILFNFPKERKKGLHKCGFKLSVDSEYRGQGIGSKLLRKIIRTAEDMKFKIIVISVFGNNQTALTMYEKYGFKICGTIPGGLFDTKRGVFVDEIIMFKKLL